MKTTQKRTLVWIVYSGIISYLMFTAGVSYCTGTLEWLSEIAVGGLLTLMVSTLDRKYSKATAKEHEDECRRKTDEASKGAYGTASHHLTAIFQEGSYVKLVGLSQDGTHKLLQGHWETKLYQNTDNGGSMKVGNHYVVKGGKLVDLLQATSEKSASPVEAIR